MGGNQQDRSVALSYKLQSDKVLGPAWASLPRLLRLEGVLNPLAISLKLLYAKRHPCLTYVAL